MEDENILLSICIPTYNRAIFLQRLLESIIGQDFYDNKIIEIIICDNKSTDNSIAMIKEYVEKYKNIRYYVNDYNIWADRNIFKAMWLWKWKYIRAMWDDDVIINWWLKEIIDIIKKDKPYLILSEHIPIHDSNKWLSFAYDLERKKLYKGKPHISFVWLSNFISFIAKKRGNCAAIFTFISIFCFERKKFMKSRKDLTKKYSEEYLENHIFNVPFCVYNWLDDHKRITFIQNHIIAQWMPPLSWLHFYNRKILKDMRDVLKDISLKINYKFKRFFVKIYIGILIMYISPFFIRILKKIGMYRYFSFLRRRFILRNLYE